MIFILLFFVLFTVILYSWLSLISDSKGLGVPGPFPLPILGDGHLFLGASERFEKSLRYLKETYGGVARFYILSKRYYLISDLKFLDTLVKSTELIVKGRSYNFLHPWLGQGLLTSTGYRWKMHRKFLTPAFHFNILHNFLPIFLKNEKILISKLKTMADGKDIDLFPIIALAALDNVTESIMGVAINSQTNSESEYVKSIRTLSEVLAYRMRNGLAAIDLLFNLSSSKKEQDKALEIVHKYSRSVIEKRRKELEILDIKTLDYDAEHGIKNKHAFLDLLLLADCDGKRIEDESVREEVDTFMFEIYGTEPFVRESDSHLADFCISQHQDVQDKIFKEQTDILGDDLNREPTYSEVQQMKYLDLVIKESFRLFPPVPLFERFITKDTEIAGSFVPKDTSLLVDVIHLQRDPNNFEEPLEFRPERFENNLKHPFSWLAFSAGPRNCIGQKFALLETKIMVSSVVRHFKILPSKSEPILVLDLVLRSRDGLHVKLKPRKTTVHPLNS